MKKKAKKAARRIVDITTNKTGAPLHARVFAKSPMRTFTKDGQEKHLFNFVLGDASSEISVLAVDPIATTLYEKITVGACFRVSSYKTKQRNPADKSSHHECELEITKVSFPVHRNRRTPNLLQV